MHVLSPMFGNKRKYNTITTHLNEEVMKCWNKKSGRCKLQHTAWKAHHKHADGDKYTHKCTSR